VNDLCTGVATSTFGGGGWTKVFCSQALNIPIATIANAARRTEAAPCPIVRRGQERAGERIDFIFRASIGLFQKNVYSEIGVRRHPMKIATIRLQ
jgi:hypothetical protein